MPMEVKRMAMSKKDITVTVVGLVLAVGSGVAGSYASLIAGVGMVVAGVGLGGIIKGNVKGK